MKINFVDLKIQFQKYKMEFVEAIEEVTEKTDFTLGQAVSDFEVDFAEFCTAKYCIGVGTGTDALHFALRAVGVGVDEEVIVPANTFIATAEAVTMCGATPVFCDVDEQTRNIDAGLLEDLINEKTIAIIPVHLYGQPDEMDKIMKIADSFDLEVIEDACQAHGAEYKSKRVGSFGKAAAFSFYPGKNLGAFGDGGAVVTDDEEIAKHVRLLRNHGEAEKYNHQIPSYCSRLHTIQAAVLNIKLKYLDEWNEARRKNAAIYTELLSGVGDIITPYVMPEVKHVFHLYVVQTKYRDELQKYLTENEIYTGIHYPVPLHLTPAYQFLGYKRGDFPVAEQLADEILSLPMYPELTAEQINYVATNIREFFQTSD